MLATVCSTFLSDSCSSPSFLLSPGFSEVFAEDPAITYGDGENLAFRFPAVGGLRKDELVRLDAVTFGYPGSDPLFVDATLRIDLKSRVGVLGRNGAGKSTLLKVRDAKLTFAHFHQDSQQCGRSRNVSTRV